MSLRGWQQHSDLGLLMRLDISQQKCIDVVLELQPNNITTRVECKDIVSRAEANELVLELKCNNIIPEVECRNVFFQRMTAAFRRRLADQ